MDSVPWSKVSTAGGASCRTRHQCQSTITLPADWLSASSSVLIVFESSRKLVVADGAFEVSHFVFSRDSMMMMMILLLLPYLTKKQSDFFGAVCGYMPLYAPVK